MPEISTGHCHPNPRPPPMTHREQIAYRVEVMQHWLNGGEVENRRKGTAQPWVDADIGIPQFTFDLYDYRKKPIKEKRKGWVNVYPKHLGMDCVYPNQALANTHASDHRIACVEIEYEFEVPQK